MPDYEIVEPPYSSTYVDENGVTHITFSDEPGTPSDTPSAGTDPAAEEPGPAGEGGEGGDGNEGEGEGEGESGGSGNEDLEAELAGLYDELAGLEDELANLQDEILDAGGNLDELEAQQGALDGLIDRLEDAEDAAGDAADGLGDLAGDLEGNLDDAGSGDPLAQPPGAPGPVQDNKVRACQGGEPVRLYSGSFFRRETDLRVPCRGLGFAFERIYSNQYYTNSVLGPKWRMNFEDRLRILSSGKVLRVTGDGTPVVYAPDGTGYRSPDGWPDTLERDGSRWRVRDGAGMVWRYSSTGRLEEIRDRFGNRIALHYTGALLTRITDANGRSYILNYDGSGHLVRLDDPEGSAISYGYQNGRLASVEYPGPATGQQGPGYSYQYQDGADPRTRHNLTRIRDLDGQLVLQNDYGAGGAEFNRVVRQWFEGGYFYYQYVLAPATGVDRRTILINRRGIQTVYDFDAEGRLVRSEVRTSGMQPGAPSGYATTFSYGPTGLLQRVTFPNGNSEEYTFDTGNADPLARGNLLEARRRSGAGGAALLQRFAYGPYNQIAQIVDEEGNTTDMSVNAGGLIERVELPPVTLPDGSTQRPAIRWEYNAAGLLIRRTDPNGLVTEYSYYTSGPRRGLLNRITRNTTGGTPAVSELQLDDMGRAQAWAVSDGVTYEYQRDRRGRLTALLRDGALFQRFTYDVYDRLALDEQRRLEPDGTPSNPEWVQTRYVYDANGRLEETRRMDGNTLLERVRFEYDAEGNTTRIVGPGAREATFAYEERGLVSEITGARGTLDQTSVRLLYDPNGNLVAQVDGNGNTFTYEIDGFSRVRRAVDPEGNADQFTYDKIGNLIQFRRYDAGNVLRGLIAIDRDALGSATRRRVARLNSAGTVQGYLDESLVRDMEGNVVRHVAANGAVTVSDYDLLGQEIRRTDPLGNVLEIGYDLAGQIVELTRRERLANGGFGIVQRRIQRNRAGQVTRVEDSAGRVETALFDNLGLRRQVTLADGVQVRAPFDLLGRPAGNSVFDPAGNQTWSEAWRYNAEGLLGEVEDALGRRTRFTYDALGRLVRVNDPAGHERLRLRYDRNGNIVEQTDGRGVTVAHQYDRLNRLVGRTVTGPAGLPGATLETYVYNALNQVVRGDNGAFQALQDYNSLGLITSSTLHGLAVTRNYLNDGSLDRLTYPCGLRLRSREDMLERPTRIDGSLVANHQFPGHTTLGHLGEYGYQGREMRGYLAARNGVRAEWSADLLGRPAALSATRGTATLLSEIQLYDRLDRVTYHEPGGPGAERARYDGRGMLLRVEPVQALANPNAVLAQAGLPAALPPGLLQNGLESLVQSLAQRPGAAAQFTYDAAGNRLQAANGTVYDYTVNALDQVSAVNGQAAAWDGAGNLVDDGLFTYAYDYANRLCRVTAKANGAVVYEAGYDAFGRLARVVENGQAHRLLYDGNRPVEQRSDTLQPERAWVWGPMPGELLMLATGGENYYGLPNLHGDLALLTTRQGTLQERYAYGLYGERVIYAEDGASLASSTVGNQFGYLGRPHVPGTPLLDLRARYLHTAWGRFTSPDPSGLAMGLNRYTYADNDPLSLADRNGHSPFVIGAALGLAFGVGWAAGSMINAGIYELTGGEWGEKWQGAGHYASQVAQFTVGGALLGASVATAGIAGGAVSAALGGAGFSALMGASKGSWDGFGGNLAKGAAIGFAVWGVAKVAAPIVAPAAGWLANTGAGVAVTSLARSGAAWAAGTRIGSAVIGGVADLSAGLSTLNGSVSASLRNLPGAAGTIAADIQRGMQLANQGPWRAFGNEALLLRNQRTAYTLRNMVSEPRSLEPVSKQYWSANSWREDAVELLMTGQLPRVAGGRAAGTASGNSLQHLWVMNSSELPAWMEGFRNSGLNLLEIPGGLNSWASNLAGRNWAIRGAVIGIGTTIGYGAYKAATDLADALFGPGDSGANCP